MIRTAYLRVYQPIESFSPAERASWEQSPSAEAPAAKEAVRRWLISASLAEGDPMADAGGAFVRQAGAITLVCPWRTRLRMLAGLLAFRDSIPEEVADAFVPEEAARLAAHELAVIGENRPHVRSHIIHSNWHVPLRWFVAFDGSERILTEDSGGLRIRYETMLGAARARIERSIDVLEEVWIDDQITEMVRNLGEWLADFPGEGILELDYASVAGSFGDDDLAEDRSAEDIWECLAALGNGDLVGAGRIFGSLSDRWGDARALEVVN
jgi:hypothetical protein